MRSRSRQLGLGGGHLKARLDAGSGTALPVAGRWCWLGAELGCPPAPATHTGPLRVDGFLPGPEPPSRRLGKS